jgi:hypothetical protein
MKKQDVLEIIKCINQSTEYHEKQIEYHEEKIRLNRIQAKVLKSQLEESEDK